MPPESAKPGEKRPLPDYDGRPDESPHAGEYLAWAPRVLLLPVHVVLEYVVRRPLVWGVARAEEAKIPQKVEDALTWNDGKGSLFPLVYADFGVRPNAGLVVRWEEFAPRHDIYVAGFAGPGDLYAAAFDLREHLFQDKTATLRWQGGYIRRPDNVFFSVNDSGGRCEDESQGCRYRSAIGEAHAKLFAFEEYLSGAEFDFTLRHARFSTEETDDPGLTEAEAEDLEGFDDGYLLLSPNLRFSLDTRANDPDFSRGTGVRWEAFGSYNVDADDTTRMWLRFGTEIAGFYDFGLGQIVGLRFYGETIGNVGTAIGGGEKTPVPFHELIALGGNQRMRSFLRGRLLGNHAYSASFEYRYPILWALDAGFYTSLGSVYESIGDFDLEKSYLNYGFLLRTSNDRRAAFEAIVGFGSNRLDSADFDGFDQFRLTLGINKGF